MVMFGGRYSALAVTDYWTLAGRRYWGVVFPKVPPGEVRVSWLDQSRTEQATATVEAGTVARLDWRRGRVR
jgi:hypothetical protein